MYRASSKPPRSTRDSRPWAEAISKRHVIVMQLRDTYKGSVASTATWNLVNVPSESDDIKYNSTKTLVDDCVNMIIVGGWILCSWNWYHAVVTGKCRDVWRVHVLQLSCAVGNFGFGHFLIPVLQRFETGSSSQDHPKTISLPSQLTAMTVQIIRAEICMKFRSLFAETYLGHPSWLESYVVYKKVTKVVPPFLHSYNYIKQNLPSFPPRHSWFGVENLKSFGHHRLIGDRTYHFKSKKHMTIVPCSTLPCWGSA